MTDEQLQRYRDKAFEYVKNNSNLTLLEYTKANEQARFKCNKCNADFKRRYQSMKKKKYRCPFCERKDFIPEKTISDTNPELIDWFVDKNIPFIKGPTSNFITKIKCPDCGFEENVKIGLFIKRICHCKNCNQDTISFPNKFLREFLRQIKSNVQLVETEYSPKWANGYLYDGHIKVNDVDYLIEMHGEFHYKETSKYNWEYQQKRDKEKIELAKQQNIELIIIDCRTSKFDFIKENILQSRLNDILDLSSIDWQEIAKGTLKNYTKIACDMYNNNFIIQDISNELMLDRHTITRMLILGTKAGICDYKPVSCVDLAKKKIKLINTETNEEKQFDYLNEMIEYMHSIGLNIDRHTVKCYADGWYWSYYKGIKKKVSITTTYHGYKFEYIN